MHRTTVTQSRRALAVVGAAALLALAGCAAPAPAPGGTEGAEEAGPLKQILARTGFGTSPYDEAQFIAIEKGYFAEEGLEVTIAEGNGSGAVMQLMGGSGDTDIGLNIDAATAAAQISQGVPAKIAELGTTIPPFGTICYESANVTSAHDLKGRTAIVVPSESTAVVLPSFLALHGLTEDDVTLVGADFSNKSALFLAGNADCMLGYTDSELVQAQMNAPDQLADPMSWADDGFELLGDSTVVSAELAEDPDTVAAFLRALHRGVQDLCSDPQAGADSYNARYASTLSEIDKEYTIIGIEATCAALTYGGAAPYAGVSDEQWDAAMALLDDAGLMQQVLPRSDYFMSGLPELPAVSW